MADRRRDAPTAAAPAARRSLSPGRLAWRVFLRNRPAVAGMVVVLAFFGIALGGLVLTRGQAPVLNPREVRLPDKLKPPLARSEHAASCRRRAGRGSACTPRHGRAGTRRLRPDAGGRVRVAVGGLRRGRHRRGASAASSAGIAGHYGRARLPTPGWMVGAAGLAVLAAVGVAVGAGSRAGGRRRCGRSSASSCSAPAWSAWCSGGRSAHGGHADRRAHRRDAVLSRPSS